MFGKKKTTSGKPAADRPPRKSSSQTKNQLKNLGLVPDVDEFGNINVGGGSDDDDDLEAELQSLMFGGSKTNKPQKRKAQVNQEHLDSMVASCMQDIPSDEEELPGGDDDDDPDLLDELAKLGASDDQDLDEVAPKVLKPSQVVTTVTVCQDSDIPCAGQSHLDMIESRIAMYAAAEKKAKDGGESARARRFARGLATLTDLRRKVKAGKGVSDDEIPPIISSAGNSEASSKVASPLEDRKPLPEEPEDIIKPLPTEPPNKVEQSKEATNDDIVKAIHEKRAVYKNLALAAKRNGDKTMAVFGLNAVKACNDILAKANAGDTVDLSSLPAVPVRQEQQRLQGHVDEDSPKQQLPVKSANQPLNRTFSRDDPIVMPEDPNDIPAPDPVLFGAPPPPASVEDALNQRLARYREDEAKAKAEGNQSRVRRLGRVCKQYEEAIKLDKRGKLHTVIDDLPCPHGFSPIPLTASAQAAQAPAVSQVAMATSVTQPDPVAAVPQVKPKAPKKHMSLQEKQLAALEKRQGQFKAAALEAKRAGQIEQAKEYLKQAKGFDKLIEAAQSGLPVDFNTLPVPPQATRDVKMDFEIVSKEDCDPKDMSGSRHEMYVKLEQDLLSQVKMCAANRQYFKSTGDVASMNKFQQMEEHTKKDLDTLRFAFKREDPVPKFHYEVRSFSKVVCCSDLTDNELEFTVVQGINYNVSNPKEVHTYCRVEFPYPKETPFKDKSIVVKDTNSPEYNYQVKVPLNIKDKACQRVFKRQSAKVEIWSKVGFLRSDSLVGTAQVKLQPLESKCVLHDTFALMDGRRVVGGSVEVKMRIRNPIVTKQIEKVEEKWLVISFK